MAETAFLTAIEAFLASLAGLSPAPASIGFAEPQNAGDLPAVVLSLIEARRRSGGQSEPIHGALAWQSSIDLANPVLPGNPPFTLLSEDRTELTLPHGGQVRSDGTSGPLGSADLAVTVSDVSQTVVNGDPNAGEVRAFPEIGQLVFGAPLAATGEVVADYFLGQWQRRTIHLHGTLRIDICAAGAIDVASLSQGITDAMLSAAAREAMAGLRDIGLSELTSIGAPESQFAAARRRQAKFFFEIEHQENRPESSGGVIRRIEIDAGFGDPRQEDAIVVVE